LSDVAHKYLGPVTALAAFFAFTRAFSSAKVFVFFVGGEGEDATPHFDAAPGKALFCRTAWLLLIPGHKHAKQWRLKWKRWSKSRCKILGEQLQQHKNKLMKLLMEIRLQNKTPHNQSKWIYFY